MRNFVQLKTTTTMAEHNDLGRWGEELAADYLRQQGYYIWKRDWRYFHRDLDIVAMEDEKHMAIVEVKTRRNEVFADAERAVNYQKMRSLTIAANAFVKTFRVDADVRFDVILIIGTTRETAVIRHIKNAFLPVVIR